MKQNFSAEKNNDLYPISPQKFFFDNPKLDGAMKSISKNNFITMDKVIKRNILRFFNIKVLDYAFGNLLWTLGLFPNADQFYGVETSEVCINYGYLNADLMNKEFVPIRIKSNDDLNNLNIIPNEYFDSVLCFAFFEILNKVEVEKVVKVIHDKLKRGGTYLYLSSF